MCRCVKHVTRQAMCCRVEAPAASAAAALRTWWSGANRTLLKIRDTDDGDDVFL